MKVYAYLATFRKDDLDLAARESDARRYFDALNNRTPTGAEWGGLFTDDPPHGFKRFIDRPEGSSLWGMLQRGDHVFFPRMDRAFCTAKDFTNVMTLLTERGIVLHFIDHGFDTASPSGQMFRTAAALVARYDSDLKSLRVKEGLAEGKQQRLKKGVYPNQEFFIAQIVYYRGLQLGWGSISDRIEREDARLQQREILPPAATFSRPSKRFWDRYRCRRAFIGWCCGKVPSFRWSPKSAA